MDLKSYLRGLGIGIAVTTILLTISFSVAKKEPSAQEIVSRAKELGMVESSAYLQNTTEMTTEESTKEQPTVTAGTLENATEKNTEATMEASTENATKATIPEETRNTETSGERTTIVVETITVELQGFQAAHQASAMLETAGVIDNAEAFTNFMIEKDYATRLLPGTYTFETGMSYEQVARRICWMD